VLASPFAILLALALVAMPALAQSSPAPCPTGIHHVELPAVPTGELPQVCISQGLSTLFSFDTDLKPEAVTLDGAERFTKVDPGQSTLKLVPSEKVRPGELLRLTVRFKDNSAPSSATFLLVVHAAQAVPLVNVHRQPRTVESYRDELQTKEEEVRQYREENARLRAESAGPGGLAGLLASGLMGGKGIVAEDLIRRIAQHPSNARSVAFIASYRAAGRVAVAVTFDDLEGTPTWTAEGATLSLEGKKGVELRVRTVWQEASIPSRKPLRVVVEAEATDQEAQGRFTLKLWEASGARTVTLGNVTFP
jgi:uncharacterized protein (TIGR02268 family)